MCVNEVMQLTTVLMATVRHPPALPKKTKQNKKTKATKGEVKALREQSLRTRR